MDKTTTKQSPQQSEIQDILSDFSQFYIVLLLSENPNHGYGMIKTFKTRTGKSLSAGTLYPFLLKLEDRGLVKKSDVSRTQRPKFMYSLTRKGQKFCGRLFQRFASLTATAIEPNLETCASCGARVYDGVHYEKIEGEKLAFCCIHCAAAYTKGLSSHKH
ncbi:MAG: helix-turn-helix transcriptional regulator [Candidatus Thorarchaeota archaeon]